MALNALTVEVGLNVKCLDAASMELGKACAARVLGLGDHEGRDKAAFDADSTISQQIMMVNVICDWVPPGYPSSKRFIRANLPSLHNFRTEYGQMALLVGLCRM